MQPHGPGGNGVGSKAFSGACSFFRPKDRHGPARHWSGIRRADRALPPVPAAVQKPARRWSDHFLILPVLPGPAPPASRKVKDNRKKYRGFSWFTSLYEEKRDIRGHNTHFCCIIIHRPSMLYSWHAQQVIPNPSELSGRRCTTAEKRKQYHKDYSWEQENVLSEKEYIKRSVIDRRSLLDMMSRFVQKAKKPLKYIKKPWNQKNQLKW